MKILSLRFKNLNSLAGEWSVDFTVPDYVSDGIFAITGPTGAGKSTLLDAMSLALYGQTPRLGRITKSSNEIMSRHTGECFSEVVFETPAGRFRCYWSQHRARKSPSGELQQQKHEISEEPGGRIIESRLQDTLAAIEERTGMDFDRFTRSMLLAQGAFAVFLQSHPDERAPVLEQITGTEIYSRISVRVHERNRLEQQKLDLLREECSGIRLLGDEELAATTASVKEREAEAAAVAGQQGRTEEALRWLRHIAVMKTELERMEEEFLELRSLEERFRPDRERLEKAIQALRFEPAYTAIRQLRQLQERELQDKTGAEEALERSKAVLEELSGTYGEAEEKLRLLREQEKTLREVAREVRSLDLRIAAGEERCRQAASEFDVLQKRIAAAGGQLAETERDILQKRTLLDEAVRYLSEHAADKALAASLSGIEEKVRQFHEAVAGEQESGTISGDASKQLERSMAALRELTPAVSVAEHDFLNCRNLRMELAGQLEGLLGGRSLRDLRREAEDLHERIRALETLHARIVQLDSLRNRSESVQRSLGDAEATLHGKVAELERLEQLQKKEEAVVEGLQREAELQGKIRALEDERRMLQAGQPCPLCGSLHHPFAADGTPPAKRSSDDALHQARLSVHERMQQITALRMAVTRLETECLLFAGQREELQLTVDTELHWCRHSAGALSIEGMPSAATIRETLAGRRQLAARQTDMLAEVERIEVADAVAAEDEKKLQQRLAEALRGQENAGYVLKTADAEAAKAAESAAAAQGKRRSAEEVLRRELLLYAIDASSGALTYPEALQLLHSRMERWQEAHERKAGAGERITILEGHLALQREQLDTIREDCRQKEKRHAAEKAAVADLQQQRDKLFGAKNPDAEERRLADALHSAEGLFEEARTARDAASQQIVTISERIALLGASSRERSVTLSEKEALFSRELSGSGFATLEGFLSARIERPQLEALEKEARALEARGLELQTLQAEREKKLRQEEDRALSAGTAETLQQEYERLSTSLASLRAEIAALQLRLLEHQQSQERLREKSAMLAAQQAECERWAVLHGLVGSSDGKKFRNFAQGLTFEAMIGHANRQLAGMTDRYQLVRSREHPLGLDVIDTWQAGEVRSTKNLSGGESFIVSLALALGLSQMSSRKVRVDSLFLDEGFGTLDEEALDTALQTLSGLRQEGKVIGVISHVPAIRERIATRIRVRSVSGGRSRLSGPGVAAGNS